MEVVEIKVANREDLGKDEDEKTTDVEHVEER